MKKKWLVLSMLLTATISMSCSDDSVDSGLSITPEQEKVESTKDEKKTVVNSDSIKVIEDENLTAETFKELKGLEQTSGGFEFSEEIENQVIATVKVQKVYDDATNDSTDVVYLVLEDGEIIIPKVFPESLANDGQKVGINYTIVADDRSDESGLEGKYADVDISYKSSDIPQDDNKDEIKVDEDDKFSKVTIPGILSGDTLYIVVDGEMTKIEWKEENNESIYVPDSKKVYLSMEDDDIVIDSVVTMDSEEREEASLSSYITGVIEGNYLVHTDYYGEKHQIYIASMKPENSEGKNAMVEGTIVMLDDDVNVTSGYVGLDQEPYVKELSGTVVIEELGKNIITYIIDENETKVPIVLSEEYKRNGALITVKAILHGTYTNSSTQPFNYFYTVEDVVDFSK